MDYEFKKLAEVESLLEVPENATVLAEVNGSVKRIPSGGLGGGGNTSGSSDEYDLTLSIYPDSQHVTIDNGSVQSVMDKINNEKRPKIHIMVNYYYNSYSFKTDANVLAVSRIFCGSGSSEGTVENYGIHILFNYVYNARVTSGTQVGAEVVIKADGTIENTRFGIFLA